MRTFVKDAIKRVLLANGYEDIVTKINNKIFSVSFFSKKSLLSLEPIMTAAKEITITRYEKEKKYNVLACVQLNQDNAIEAYHQMLDMFVAVCRLK